MSPPELSTNYHAAHLRSWRAARKAAGMCRDCRAPVKTGIRCDAHAEAAAEQERARYRRWKARRDEARARVMQP